MVQLPDNAWFAAQVVPRSEKKVALMLEYKGYEQFAPTVLSKKKWSDRIKTQEEPLFPGYVFVRISGRAFGGLLCSTPGIVRILSFGGKPTPLADSEIDVIHRLTLLAKPLPTRLVNTGDKVRIRDGPFAGIVGVVKQIKNRTCLVFTVQLISQSIYVEVDEFQVEHIEPAALTVNLQSAPELGITRTSAGALSTGA
jgi:transcription antitermination factor NusG